MVSEPSISVIIPTYNRPDHALRAIETVCHQTEAPSELIIINDGSDCDYTQVINKLDSIPFETRYLETVNQGAPAARNTGASFATGDVYMFLDDDDYWTKSKVQRQQELLMSSPDAGLVYSGLTLVGEDGQPIYDVEVSKYGDISTQILQKNVIKGTSNVGVRASLFESVDGFDEDLPALQDWELWIRVCQQTLVVVDQDCRVKSIKHNDTSGQITGDPERFLEAIEIIRDKHSEKFDSLSTIQLRKAVANQQAILADKYANSNSYWQYIFAVQSLATFPTISGFSKIFPQSLVTQLRGRF
jgi:glycosyltransferase involved in cell wall biosynthesis